MNLYQTIFWQNCQYSASYTVKTPLFSEVVLSDLRVKVKLKVTASREVTVKVSQNWKESAAFNICSETAHNASHVSDSNKLHPGFHPLQMLRMSLWLLVAVFVWGFASCSITCPDGSICSDFATCCLTKHGYSCCQYPNVSHMCQHKVTWSVLFRLSRLTFWSGKLPVFLP